MLNMKIFHTHPKKLLQLESKFATRLHKLYKINKRILDELFNITGKKAKGDQLVALLGEAFIAKLLGGKVIAEESSETDVVVNKKRISVKTRKGSGKGWNHTSTIPTNNVNAVDYLAFVHLNDSYLVEKVWIFPWKQLIQAGRIKQKTVRGISRGFVFRLSPQNDTIYIHYQIKK